MKNRGDTQVFLGGIVTLCVVCTMLPVAAASAGTMALRPVEVAQSQGGSCGNLDPVSFGSVADFSAAVLERSGGFESPADQAGAVQCAERLQLAGFYEEIDNPPVVIAIQELLRACDREGGSARTCGRIQAVLHDAVLANSRTITTQDDVFICRQGMCQ